METTDNLGAFDRMRQWMRTSVTLKLLSIGFILLILMIPLEMIRDLVRERSYRLDEAIAEVSSSWGTEQDLQALVLSIPFDRWHEQKKTDGSVELVKTEHIFRLYPETTHFNGDVNAEYRKRGIFDIPVYRTSLAINGEFQLPSSPTIFAAEAADIHWDQATLSLLLTDLKGLESQVVVKCPEPLTFDPSNASNNKAVLQTSIDLTDRVGESLKFSFDLNLKGSNTLAFAPLAKTTSAQIKSNWAHPKFQGAFLPEHNIQDDGCTASWNVLHLNRPLAQFAIDTNLDRGAGAYAFGMNLYDPVNGYVKTERAAKYAMLLMTLTFALFFLVQVIRKVSIHPMQFFLVGLALSVFYTLLLSLSEHLSFFKSYALASLAITLLITGYIHATFRNIKLSGLLFGLLGVLYVYIYSTLQLEDKALLVGSLGLFAALALVMFATRNFDWYNLRSREADLQLKV